MTSQVNFFDVETNDVIPLRMRVIKKLEKLINDCKSIIHSFLQNREFSGIISEYIDTCFNTWIDQVLV